MSKIDKPYTVNKRTKTGGREHVKDFDTEQEAKNYITQREVTDPGDYFITTPDEYNNKSVKDGKHWYWG